MQVLHLPLLPQKKRTFASLSWSLTVILFFQFYCDPSMYLASSSLNNDAPWPPGPTIAVYLAPLLKKESCNNI